MGRESLLLAGSRPLYIPSLCDYIDYKHEKGKRAEGAEEETGKKKSLTYSTSLKWNYATAHIILH